MIDPVLIVGATGQLGGVVARKLVARGVAVRALVRNPAKSRDLEGLGIGVVQGDLLEPNTLAEACRGIGQLFSTANSFSGTGTNSPTRVDVPGYRHLVVAARAAKVRRLVHTSAFGLTAENPVDYFKVKVQVDEVIRESGVPFVLLKPTAFMEIWVGMVVDGVKQGTVRIFGDGTTRANLIAVDDVAEFAVRVLAKPDVVNESIDLGGPTTASQLEIVAQVERALGKVAKRQKMPTPVLRVGAMLIRPFNELMARYMMLGFWSASTDRPLANWQQAADRFGVAPRTLEKFVESLRPT